MTFRIAHERTFTHPVHAAGGESFKAEFVILPDDDLGGDGATGPEAEKATLRRIVRGLSEIEGADGEEVSFDAAVLETVIGFFDLRIALLRAYNEGRLEARRGN
jgi:hypothetical protein